MEVFLQALVNGILLGGFYSLMGMGQNIIFGVMNIVNFCHGEMLMVGMYITYVLYTYFGVDPYVALPIVAVLMFGLGALIQSTLITPSLKTKSFTNLLFLTVGLGLLLTNGALVIFGSTYYKIITPYSQTYIPLGPVTIALPRLVSFLILIVVAIALFAFLKYSTTGKQIRAVSQNPIGAEVVGINVKKIYIQRALSQNLEVVGGQGQTHSEHDDAENDGLSSSAHPVEGMWEEECEHCNTYHEDRCVIGQQLAEPLK